MQELRTLPKDTFSTITHPDNIRKAYLELVSKFDKESKSGRYRGIDGTKMVNLDFVSEEVLSSIEQEMKSLKKIAPAYMANIPKKNGKKRKIYVYPVKERIKAEAIYRVLLPFFDSYLSPFLFSYRSSHPSYFAAKSAVRRYKRHYGKNYVLVTDISDYADTIDHSILLEKLVALGLDKETLILLELFIKTDTYEEGRVVVRPRGVLTGTPLYALLSNFYMDDFDKWAGKQVAFYRRVGDDIIAMDKDQEKINRVNERLSETVDALKIKLNREKGKLIKDTEEFKFLGYSFKDGKVGFDASSKNKAIAAWKKMIFSSRARSLASKKRHIKSFSKGAQNINNQFKQLVEQKRLVDDHVQLKDFSERFFIMLTSYLKGSYTPKHRRLAEPLLRKMKISSLFTHYHEAKYPKTHATRK